MKPLSFNFQKKLMKRDSEVQILHHLALFQAGWSIGRGAVALTLLSSWNISLFVFILLL